MLLNMLLQTSLTISATGATITALSLISAIIFNSIFIHKSNRREINRQIEKVESLKADRSELKALEKQNNIQFDSVKEAMDENNATTYYIRDKIDKLHEKLIG